MYRRKSGRAVEVEEDLDNEEDEDIDPELVEILDDGDIEVALGQPVAPTPVVKKGKGKISKGVTARTTTKRKSNKSRKATVNVQVPPKAGRTTSISPVAVLEGGQEDFDVFLGAIGATNTDKDGVPYLSSASQLSQSHKEQPNSNNRPRVPVKGRGAGRRRGFATSSMSKLTQAQEIFGPDEVEDFTFGLNNISDTSER